ncbi:hypothetical protein IWW39_000049 [Coemansia spiralis]|uniref:Uncharacterized protein n=1 Tax=Coemansia spiralis TaxID=417178 RepID=A0A9W8GSR0_9FUNG|nr:hypothetical protein IWW39_000049 [Coemansia spiralis]
MATDHLSEDQANAFASDQVTVHSVGIKQVINAINKAIDRLGGDYKGFPGFEEPTEMAIRSAPNIYVWPSSLRARDLSDEGSLQYYMEYNSKNIVLELMKKYNQGEKWAAKAYSVAYVPEWATTDEQYGVVVEGAATLVHRKPREKLPAIGSNLFKCPEMPEQVKRMMDTPKPGEEPKEYYWMVTDVMAFDNVGVSHTKDGIKYLSCADCDLAPIGYHDTQVAVGDKTEYLIATDRVAYKQ